METLRPIVCGSKRFIRRVIGAMDKQTSSSMAGAMRRIWAHKAAWLGPFLQISEEEGMFPLRLFLSHVWHSDGRELQRIILDHEVRSPW